MGIAFALLGWGKAALAWLASLPWYVLVIGALVLFGGWEARKASLWHERAVVAEKALKAVRDAQAAADKAALAKAKVKDAANRSNDKDTTDALKEQVAHAGNVADTLRVRIAQLERQTGGKHQGGPSASAGGTDDAYDLRLPLSDELALREAAESERLKRNALIDWEVRRAAIEAQ